MLLNVFWVLILLLASLAYLPLIGRHIPNGYALAVNFMLVPLVLGCAGYFLLNARLPTKFLFLAALPLAQIAYFGGDSTKPGLENVLAVGEYLFICIGVALGFVVNKYIYQNNVSR